MRGFEGKVAVITGGPRGIGFALAKKFGAAGTAVVLADVDERRLQEAVDALQKNGFQASYHLTDVSDRAQVEALADYAWAAYGHVDMVINNAHAALPSTSMLDIPTEDVERIFAVNFYGVWHSSTVFARRFIDQGTSAGIYNAGSENSLFNDVPLSAPYVATKLAVFAITEELAIDTPKFIEVGLISPGFVASEILDPELTAGEMDADYYAGVAFEQIKAGEFFVVSQAYNIVRINRRHVAIARTYAAYAPR